MTHLSRDDCGPREQAGRSGRCEFHIHGGQSWSRSICGLIRDVPSGGQEKGYFVSAVGYFAQGERVEGLWKTESCLRSFLKIA
jgi:hypothetical protein